MSTNKILNKLISKMKKTKELYSQFELEPNQDMSLFTSEKDSVEGLNNQYISRAEFEQMAEFQKFLKQHVDLNLDEFKRYILESKEKHLRLIKRMLEAIPDLLERMIAKDDVRGFAIEYIIMTNESLPQNPKNVINKKEKLKYDKEFEYDYESDDCEDDFIDEDDVSQD